MRRSIVLCASALLLISGVSSFLYWSATDPTVGTPLHIPLAQLRCDDVFPSDSLDLTIEVENRSRNVVTVGSIAKDCGCVSIGSSLPLRFSPRERKRLLLTVDTTKGGLSYEGEFAGRFVLIGLDGKAVSEVAHLTGNSRSPLKVSGGGTIHFDGAETLTVGRSRSPKTVRVRPIDRLRGLDIRFDPNVVKVHLTHSSDGEDYIVEVNPPILHTPGEFSTVVYLDATLIDGQTASIPLFVRGSADWAVKIAPSVGTIELPDTTPGLAQELRVILRSAAGIGFEVETVQLHKASCNFAVNVELVQHDEQKSICNLTMTLLKQLPHNNTYSEAIDFHIRELGTEMAYVQSLPLIVVCPG